MHIGIDASRAFLKERTGTEEYSYQLIKALTEIDRKNNYTLYIRDKSATTFPLPSNFRFKMITFPRFWTQAGLALECLRHPPDTLFIPAHTLPVLHRPGLQTVVTIHDLGSEFLPQHHQFPQKLYLNKSTAYAVHHATRLIAVSRSTKNDLINKLHCNPQKISVIHEGYDNEKFLPCRQAGKIENDRSQSKIKKVLEKYKIKDPYILFVGTIQPRKNLLRLIEAFAKVLKSSKRKKEKDLRLVVVGKPGWMHKEIYAAPRKFGIEEKVRFLGYVPKDVLPVFYQNAICFVLPSLYEGFGLPVLEAMACGCPVLTSKVSSLPEIAGGAAILVDPYDVGDIAKNLQLITCPSGRRVENLQLRKIMIERGLKQIQKFSWKRCAEETLQVLEKV